MLIFLLFFTGVSSLALADREEFYIVTDAPVVVGGGLIRHYQHTENGLLSTRYSYQGSDPETIFIEKTTRQGDDRDVRKELIKISFNNPGGKKTGALDVGSHKVCFEVKKDGRLLVKEKK